MRDVLKGTKSKTLKLEPHAGHHKYSGVSLLNRINSTRTCAEAGIPTIYCPYIDWTANVIPLARIIVLAKKFVRFLNKYQRRYFAKFGIVSDLPCEEKSLKRAQNGGILEPGRFYLIIFAGSPGSGPFASEFEVSGTYTGNFRNVKYSVSTSALT